MKKPYLRFVTASALFDGHDASINIIRRLLQAKGVEVIHLGHNRSVDEIVTAALQEDVDGIALSSYQGGHMEFFQYILEQLHKNNASHIRVFGGGGGVILPKEVDKLHDLGVCKIFTPEDGKRLGLDGMIEYMMKECYKCKKVTVSSLNKITKDDKAEIGRVITALENKEIQNSFQINKQNTFVIGITGTGGAGKSTLIDELLLRLLSIYPTAYFGLISIDPTKKKTKGALLGDRIRMNAIYHPRVFLRSLATRESSSEISGAIYEIIALLSEKNYNILFVETSGIGQGDAAIVDAVDCSMYIMTSEYGAPTQLEKIDMIDYAEIVVINKFDKSGSEDALRFVQKQYQRSHNLFSQDIKQMPVIGTIAHQFNNSGVNQLCQLICQKIDDATGNKLSKNEIKYAVNNNSAVIPANKKHYLRKIIETIKKYYERIEYDAGALDSYEAACKMTNEPTLSNETMKEIEMLREKKYKQLSEEAKQFLKHYPVLQREYEKEVLTFHIREKSINYPLHYRTLSGLNVPKISLPKYKGLYDLYRWYKTENVPGYFPFTGGVFPLKREEEDPKRQFAGEGGPKRTNKRFHYLSKEERAKRLSVAFDSVTLYGEDPHVRPDIFGKIGESGVSICTLENMKELFEGFNLCDPNTSVSMTINGPAPIILAMYFQTAISQQIRKKEQEILRPLTTIECNDVKQQTLRNIRGTVQADILKEDQGQNTCIFSTDFSLRLMGDMQEYFIENEIKNYYSVSISGYHIAEAGANPVTQLAFTLANGFTYVEYYKNRGMDINLFARNFSFFFSNGLDPEYSVIGRVARRIWSIALKENYHADERSQKLKYHIQTSGRSLHAEEIEFNDIRTTLQALLAYYDHCNSLHTNAYDEAITTPTEKSVRRAMAIQLIITKEFGLTKSENVNQGSFVIEELTELVEEAVLQELERIDNRGGVLGGMEVQYQRSKIQEESFYYESQKHDGSLPIVGVNTFLNKETSRNERDGMTVARASLQEKQEQVEHVGEFNKKHEREGAQALQNLRVAAFSGENLFPYLMECVNYCSLGRITKVLYEIGGQYRRNM